MDRKDSKKVLHREMRKVAEEKKVREEEEEEEEVNEVEEEGRCRDMRKQ